MKNYKSNKIFAMLFGYILGDGWIDINHLGGVSGDLEALEIIKKDMQDLFGDIGKATILCRKTSSPKYKIKGTSNQFSFNRKTSRIFIEHGMPTGKCVETDYKLPDWIINGSIEIKKAFLSGFYAAEGTKIIPAICKGFKTLNFSQSKRIELSNSLEYLMINQIGGILTDLDLKYSIERKEVFTCAKNLRIRLDISNSTKSLLKCIEILDMRYCPRKQILFNQAYDYLYNVKILKKYGAVKNAPDFVTYVINNPSCSFKTPLNNETPEKDNDVPSLLNK